MTVIGEDYLKIKAEVDEAEFFRIFPSRTKFATYRGSVAHNMYVPESDPNSIDDVDVMGIFVGDAKFYFGFKDDKDSSTGFVGKYDYLNYELRKFIRLLAGANPNVVSMLWTKPEHRIIESPISDELIRNRDIFSSRRFYNSFKGYSHGELERMVKLTPEIIALIESLEADLTSAGVDIKTLKASEKQRKVIVNGYTVESIIKQYEALKKKYYANGYLGEKRKELIKRIGWNSKAAAHVIRLQRMQVTFLNSGYLEVFREHDRDELLAIKKGEWTLEEVRTESARLFEEADKALENSPLPENPDMEAIEQMCVDLIYKEVY